VHTRAPIRYLRRDTGLSTNRARKYCTTEIPKIMVKRVHPNDAEPRMRKLMICAELTD
jgi:hypothetical protein